MADICKLFQYEDIVLQVRDFHYKDETVSRSL